MPKTGRRRRRICPVCGDYGSGPYLKTVWAVKSDGYRGPKVRHLYFAHRVKGLDGKWRVKWCYIPMERLYEKEKAPKEIEIKEIIAPPAPGPGEAPKEVIEIKDTITPPAPEPAKSLFNLVRRLFRRV